MQTLSGRLALAASFVETGSRVCDVGTDHGYLPVFLYKSGRCESLCATEINKKPFLNAKANIEKNNCDIEVFLCDGLEGVSPDRVDTVIITGMGGDVISGIIERAPDFMKSGVSFILQPMTAAGALREYLAKRGFNIIKEQAVSDGGRLYTVMLTEFNGKPYGLTPANRRIGILKPDTPDNTAYIKRQQRLCRELCESLESVPEKRELLNEERAALQQINDLLG